MILEDADEEIATDFRGVSEALYTQPRKAKRRSGGG